MPATLGDRADDLGGAAAGVRSGHGMKRRCDMVFLWIGIAVVVVLLGVAARIDLNARRAGRPIRGVDGKANLDGRRSAQTELNMRSHNQTYGGPF
jgi:hypothetical protein